MTKSVRVSEIMTKATRHAISVMDGRSTGKYSPNKKVDFPASEHSALTSLMGMTELEGRDVSLRWRLAGPYGGMWYLQAFNSKKRTESWCGVAVTPATIAGWISENLHLGDRAQYFIRDTKSSGKPAYYTVDRGIGSVVVQLLHMGCKTHWSCAGHPYRGYVNFTPSAEFVMPSTKSLEAADWSVVRLTEQHKELNGTPNVVGLRANQGPTPSEVCRLQWLTRNHNLDRLLDVLRKSNPTLSYDLEPDLLYGYIAGARIES